MTSKTAGLVLALWLLMLAAIASAGALGSEKAPASKDHGAVQTALAKPAPEATRPNRPAAPPQVTQTVTVEQFRAALHTFLVKRFKDKVAEVDVQILAPDEAVTVPAGRLETRIRPRGLQESFGHRMFEVALIIDSKEVQTVKVLADVTMQADVLTVTRSIRPEETLEAEDLKLSRVTLPSGGHDYVTDMEQVVGKRVVKTLREESPVRLSSVALPEIIAKGDQVTIEVRHGGLHIQANGTTKSGGSMGQSITVLNQDSRKEVRAKIVGPGVVRVEF